MKGLVQRSARAVRTSFGKFASVCMLAVALSPMAYAQSTDLIGAATSEISGAKSGINGLLVILIGIVFLFVLYSLIKKSK